MTIVSISSPGEVIKKALKAFPHTYCWPLTGRGVAQNAVGEIISEEMLVSAHQRSWAGGMIDRDQRVDGA
ncbi:hypothetical protein KCP73_17955 [Salmonella enterica subsp. enterica]|nr:hypothetical protein KCP73_17955 [Salmonella enterica subsp. enterica]